MGETFYFLQYLRAFSAIIVVLFHINAGVNGYYPYAQSLNFFSMGYLGVQLFFCLSGFLISYSGYIKVKSFSSFLKTRIFRIYPTYILITLIYLSLTIFFPEVFNREKNIEFIDIINTLFFLNIEKTNYVFVSWTLFYQFIFYICFSFISKKFDKLSKTDFFSIFISCSLLICYLINSVSTKYIALFFVGIGIFLLNFEILSIKRSKITFLFLLISLILSLFFNVEAFFSGLLILLLITLESRKKVSPLPRIINIANASYSIYIIQVLTYPASLKISFYLINLLPISDNKYILFYFLSMFLGLLSTIYSGELIYKYFENPIYLLLKKRFLTLN